MELRVKYIRKVVFLALLFVPTLQIWGQKEAWEEIVQKNLTLGKDIKCLRDSVSSKQKREAKLKDEIKKANSLIEEKEAKLAESIQSNSTENLAKLEAENSKLKDTNIQLNKKYCENEKIYAELSKKLNDIKNKMGGMDTYQSIQNEINYKQNIQYLTQRYSLIDSKKLEELQNTLDNYKSFNGFEDYKKRVNAAVKNKEMYERGVNALNSEFNNTNIVNIRKKIIPLLDLKKDNIAQGVYRLSKAQFPEMDSLDIRLSRFADGLRELKSIIYKINHDKNIQADRSQKNTKNKKDCVDKIRHYIILGENKDLELVYSKYFNLIPFLDKLVRRYWKELKANPFEVPTQTEQLIENMNVK